MNNIIIALTIDNNFAQYLRVTLQSLVAHSSNISFYYIYILHSGLTNYNRSKILNIIHNKNNVKIEFIDISNEIKPYQLKSNLKHVSNATFYRYLIPKVLSQYDKILYLDTDIIINTDIQMLFNYNITNYYFGACYDLTTMQALCSKLTPFIYYRDKLKISNPIYEYFNAGILLFNNKKLNDDKITEKMFQLAVNNNFQYSGQDPMNVATHLNVKFLPIKWNLTNYHPTPNTINHIPEEVQFEYKRDIKNPGIIHFSTEFKPWNVPESELSEYWWKYANEALSPEEMLNNFPEGFFKAIKLGLTDYHFSIEQFLQLKQEYKTKIKNLKLKKIFSYGKRKSTIKQELRKLKAIYNDINYIIEIMEVM